MTALLYSLNDPDERVRSKAADEIGDQLRVSPGCCSDTVVNALKYALADCDRFVRRQAEEALRCAGFDLVDCVKGCDVACTPNGCVPQVVSRNAIQPAQPEKLARQPADDAAPVQTVASSSVVPPPVERSLSVESQNAMRAIFESPVASTDAPIPVPAGTAVHALGAARSPQTAEKSRPFLRKQPLRQTLSNLFNQAK